MTVLSGRFNQPFHLNPSLSRMQTACTMIILSSLFCCNPESYRYKANAAIAPASFVKREHSLFAYIVRYTKLWAVGPLDFCGIARITHKQSVPLVSLGFKLIVLNLIESPSAKTTQLSRVMFENA